MSSIYLDNNATTPVFPEVMQCMTDAWATAFANPGSQHSYGREARRVLEDSRESIAEILTADASEVFFTSGGTESINSASVSELVKLFFWIQARMVLNDDTMAAI